MSFPRYPDYKDSGVAWLGEVPAHWDLVSLKRVAKIQYGIGEPPKYLEAGTPLIRATNVNAGRITENGLVFVDPEDIPENRIVWLSPGDIVVVRSGAYTGDSAIILEENCPCIAGFDMVMHPTGCNSVFLQYVFLSKYLKDHQIDLEKLRAAQPHLNAEELGHCFILLPSPQEQSAITAFLDRETARIDALVVEQERLIELLKEKRQAVISHVVTKGLNPDAPMKDSGIEWLGKVPEHWSVVALGYRYDVQLGKMLDSDKIVGNNLRPYLRVFDVQWGKINTDDLPVMDFNEIDRMKFRLQPGDVIVNEGGSYIGRSAIWNGEIDECYYQKALHRLRPINNGDDDVRYFVNIMSFAANIGVFVAGGGQTTIEHLTAESFRHYHFCFPPLAEQRSIADFLDCETTKLDTLIAEAQRAIDLLKERRAALISATVTGQIDVRGLVADNHASAERAPA